MNNKNTPSPKTLRLVAIQKHTYGNREYRPGESYEAEARFAFALITVGVAKAEESKTTTSPQSTNEVKTTNAREYERRDLEAKK